MERQIDKTVSLLRRNLSPGKRLNLRTLLILLIQAQNILNRLIEKNVDSLEHFEWLGQMRYYFDEYKIEVKMLLSKLLYGFEYIGNKSRMVITPLTDRCYRTVFVALNQHFGLALQVIVILYGLSTTATTTTIYRMCNQRQNILIERVWPALVKRN